MLTRTFPPGAAQGDVTIVIPKPLAAQVSCTTAGTTTVTSSNGFTDVVAGMAVSGIGIPAGTTVASVESLSSLTLSQAASDSTTNVRFFGGASINSVKNSTTTVTSAALFASVFPGMRVSGPGIPAGTTVAAIASASSLTLSAAATDSLTNTLCFHYPRGTWAIRAIKARFVSDANAANRVVKITVDDGANTIYVSPNDVAQTLTVTCDFQAFQAGSMEAAPAGTATARVYALPTLDVQAGYRILLTATNKAAGDAFSNIVLLLDEKASSVPDA